MLPSVEGDEQSDCARAFRKLLLGFGRHAAELWTPDALGSWVCFPSIHGTGRTEFEGVLRDASVDQRLRATECPRSAYRRDDRNQYRRRPRSTR